MCRKHAMPRRKAEVPGTADGRAEAASGEIAPRRSRTLPLAAHEHRRVEALCLGQAGKEPLPLRAMVCRLLFGELYAGTVCKIADGIGELEVLPALDIAEHIAAGTAAEAVPEASLGIHLERRRLLMMERAAAPKFLATLLQHDGLADKLDDIGRLPDALLVFVGYQQIAPSLSALRFTCTHSMFPRTTASSSAIEENLRCALSQRQKTTCTSRP